MNTNPNPPAPDPTLRSLLRESLPGPDLPPRFAESVWRRLERAEAKAVTPSWLDRLAGLVLQPRLAFATVTAVMLAGAALGFLTADDAAREAARASYVARVSPFLAAPRL